MVSISLETTRFGSKIIKPFYVLQVRSSEIVVSISLDLHLSSSIEFSLGLKSHSTLKNDMECVMMQGLIDLHCKI
jgi:hypothetical protein